MPTAIAPSPGLCDPNRPHALRRELFSGRGAVRVWSLTDAPSPPFTAVLACELEAGASVGPHVQEQYPELVIPISGSGSVAVDGVRLAFEPGCVVELALGRTLAINNSSDTEPLRYLIIKALATGP